MEASEAFERIAQEHVASMNSVGITQDMLEYRYPLFCDTCGETTMHRSLPDMGNNERYQCHCRTIKFFAVR